MAVLMERHMRRYIVTAALVLCGLAAGLAASEQGNADEQKAIDAIKKLGGSITRDENALRQAGSGRGRSAR